MQHRHGFQKGVQLGAVFFRTAGFERPFVKFAQCRQGQEQGFFGWHWRGNIDLAGQVVNSDLVSSRMPRAIRIPHGSAQKRHFKSLSAFVTQCSVGLTQQYQPFFLRCFAQTVDIAGHIDELGRRQALQVRLFGVNDLQEHGGG